MLSHTHSISTAPAPSLTPATIAALNSCQVIIGDILHSNEANTDTLRYLNARNDANLANVAKDTMSMLKERQQTLVKYLSQVENREIQVSEKVKKLWSEKLDATNVILTVLVDADKAESELDEGAKANRHAFFKTAKQAWEVNLAGILVQLSKEMAGPYSLGNDCHISKRHGTNVGLKGTSTRLQTCTSLVGCQGLRASAEGMLTTMVRRLSRRLKTTLEG